MNAAGSVVERIEGAGGTLAVNVRRLASVFQRTPPISRKSSEHIKSKFAPPLRKRGEILGSSSRLRELSWLAKPKSFVNTLAIFDLG